MMDMMDGGNGMMGGMWFFSLLFWTVIIIGTIFVIRWFSQGNKNPPPPTETALDVLKKRYARGEIDKDTFERMKHDIGGG